MGCHMSSEISSGIVLPVHNRSFCLLLVAAVSGEAAFKGNADKSMAYVTATSNTGCLICMCVLLECA